MMTLDEVEALRRKLTPVRNRLTTLLNTCDVALKEPERPELIKSIVRQLLELKEYS